MKRSILHKKNEPKYYIIWIRSLISKNDMIVDWVGNLHSRLDIMDRYGEYFKDESIIITNYKRVSRLEMLLFFKGENS